MIRHKRAISVMIYTAFLASCASERTVSVEKGQEQGLDKFQSKVQFVKKKDGSVVPNQDLRSQFDGKRNNLGKKDFKGEDYTKNEYATKRWGGKKNFETGQFRGKTDANQYKHSPYFVQQQSRMQGQYVADGQKRFKTHQVATSQSSESKQKPLVYGADTETKIRRRNNLQPRIISRDDYNKLNVEDTRTMLGR